MSPTPPELKALQDKRLLAFKRGEWGEVIKACGAILDIRAGDPLACHDLCVAHWRRGDREEARSWARKTCAAFLDEEVNSPVEQQMTQMLTLIKVGKASPRYMRHYEVLGEILYEEGAFEAARDYFEQLTKIEGHFSRKYIYIFKCDLHMGDMRMARPQYQRMAREFPGREGHLLVSFREYLGRHLDDNDALDLYVQLLEEAGIREREAQKLAEEIQQASTVEAAALMRAHHRFSRDTASELDLVMASLKGDPDNPRLLVDYARLNLDDSPERGVKSLVRAIQALPEPTDALREVVEDYLRRGPEEVHEHLCKGILAFVEETEARGWLLDLSAAIPDNMILKSLKSEWAGTSDSFDTAPGAVTQILDNLSLTELIKAKMRMDEKISSAKKETSFLALDVVGSTRLKEGVSPERVTVTFDGFHRLVDRAVKSNGGDPFLDEGDGKVARFRRAIDAVRAAREIQEKLVEFNDEGNKLGAPLTMRMGIHTGLSLIDDTLDHKRVADHVLDVACHLEKYGEPGEIHLSEESVADAGLESRDIVKLGWREKSGVTAYKLV